MSKIAILTDSSCDLSAEYISELPIKVIPLRIVFEEKEYRDKIEITSDEIYEKMVEEIPKTSLPSPEDVLKGISDLEAQGYTDVIGLFISSGLSGTFNVIRNIADQYKGPMNIRIIDSFQVSMGLGYTVWEAAKIAASEGEVDEVIEVIKKTLKLIQVDFVVGTLDYLRKGGRISHFSGTVGELLQVKPILTIQDGSIETVKKVNGRKKSIRMLLEKTDEDKKRIPQYISVLHANAKKEAVLVKETLLEKYPEALVSVEEISAVVGVHTGPGLIGLVFY